MDDEKTEKVNSFLHELYRQTDSDEIQQVSMHSVGAGIGLDRDEATALAEELMIEDLVELKTLAGEVGITEAGLEVLQRNGLIAHGLATSYTLSGEEVLTEEDRQVIEKFLSAIKQALIDDTPEYEALEEVVIDIKTVEVQLLSPQPKTAIILAVLSSLRDSLRRIHGEKIIEEFEAILAPL